MHKWNSIYCHLKIGLSHYRRAETKLNRAGGRQQYARKPRKGTEAGECGKQMKVIKAGKIVRSVEVQLYIVRGSWKGF